MNTFRHGETISEMLELENDARKKMYLNEINIQYKKWRNENMEISENNKTTINQKIELYKNYRYFLFSKKFRDENTFVKSRKLFETVLSEFTYFLLKDLEFLKDENIFLARAELPLSIKFKYNSARNLRNSKFLKTPLQKMRLVIGQNVELKYRIQGRKTFVSKDINLPFIVIETTMVLDEWNAINFHNLARRFKKIFPQTMFLKFVEVVREDFDIDVNSLNINEIFVIQQQTTNMKRKDISAEVISAFLNKIQDYFSKKKEDFIQKIETGILIK